MDAQHTETALQAVEQPDEAPAAGRFARVLLFLWGVVMLAAVLVGVVGFLVHFFLLQR